MFLDSLPPMPITTDIDAVTAFFASREVSEAPPRAALPTGARNEGAAGN